MSTPFAALGSQSVTFAKAYRAEELRTTTRPARPAPGSRRRTARRLRIRLSSFTRAVAPRHRPLQEES